MSWNVGFGENGAQISHDPEMLNPLEVPRAALTFWAGQFGGHAQASARSADAW